MTRWLDPATGLATLLRLMVPPHPDRCRDEQPNDQPAPLDLPSAGPEDTVWFDYVADLGDAFDPTFAIAVLLAAEAVDGRKLRGWNDDANARNRPDPALELGGLLVFVGDNVYPYATRWKYARNTVGRYGLAEDLAGGPPPDDTSAPVAIPGNQDWYGGLGPFLTTFGTGGQVGARRTVQQCNWWSVKLGHGWWLWGVDTGLDGSLNATQDAYFARAAEDLTADDRVVLVTPVPLWRLAEKSPADLRVIDGLVSRHIGSPGGGRW